MKNYNFIVVFYDSRNIHHRMDLKLFDTMFIFLFNTPNGTFKIFILNLMVKTII